ncbi:hypothetical protein ACOME3_001412 [Neoechinorhynchus agilis]
MTIISIQGDCGNFNEEDTVHVADLHFMKNGTPVLLVGNCVWYGSVLQSSSQKRTLLTERSDSKGYHGATHISDFRLVFNRRPVTVIVDEEKLKRISTL